MTSSLKNSLHRRNHKERSQPTNRSRLGVLEKHKDYVLRARDYNSKKERLQKLKEKAALRNKDEFYFSMSHERTRVCVSYPFSHLLIVSQGGVHIKERERVALPVDVVKALKSQDENYLRSRRAIDLKVGRLNRK